MIQVEKVVTKKLFKLIAFCLFTFVQSCSSDPIGQELSNKFDYPDNISNKNKSKNKVEKKVIYKNFEDKKNITTLTEKKSNLEQKNKQKTETTKKIKIRRERLIKIDPKPYRLILKLSESNPSAPGEKVTKILRDAGVTFEVEKIERYDVKSFRDSSSTYK